MLTKATKTGRAGTSGARNSSPELDTRAVMKTIHHLPQVFGGTAGKGNRQTLRQTDTQREHHA